MNTKQLLEEAEGSKALGLYAEAEAALRKVEANDPTMRSYAQSQLIELFHGLRRFQEAADLGGALIARGVIRYSPIINTMLALQYLGRIEEARDTLLLVEKCGHPLSDDAYQMACFESRLGNFPEALRWLLLEFRRSEDYYAHALGDTDLRPLWEWLRDYKPTLEEAHLFVETRFKDVCAAARDKDTPIQLSPDDLTHFPEGMRRLFRYEVKAGYFTLNPLAVAQEPGAAAQFEHDWRAGLERVEGFIREGHKHAADVVLDAQVRYAVEHARWGNHLGARYHILWALKFRPALILDFLNEPSLELMRPFLTEILRARRGDKDFQKRMGEVEAYTLTDPDHALSLLEETPEAGRTTGLFQLRLAGLYNADKDYERALPLWAELRRLWPEDAAAFGNAIEALEKLGRNDEARRLLADAPACYRRFRKYWEQMATLEGVRRDLPPAGCTTFRGQSDLGGLLIPENEPAAGSEAKPEPRGIMKELTTEEALKRSAEYAQSAGEMLAILRSHNPGYDEATRKLWTQFQEGMDLIVFDDDLEVIYWIKADVERALGERRLDDLKAHLKKALAWCDRHREDIPFEQVREKFQAALETCERAIGGTSSEQEPPATDL